MFCVYVLHSIKHNRLYIGQTASLIARFHSHNKLAKKGFTARYRPWLVVHVEYFDTRSKALKREKGLKSGKGRQWIREKILPLYF